MSKRYDVTLPVYGLVIVTVEANSEKEAIEAALSLDPFPLKVETVGDAELLELETVGRITSGNVLHVSQNAAEAVLSIGEDAQ